MAEPSSSDHPSAEAIWLRDHWDAETLGPYEGFWISVIREGVTDKDTSISNLIVRTKTSNPLYAYVMLGPRQ